MNQSNTHEKGLLHKIELQSYMATTKHPIPHPHWMPTTSTIPGAGWPKRGGNSSKIRILNISSKMDPIQIQFEADSKQLRKIVNPKLFRTFVPSIT